MIMIGEKCFWVDVPHSGGEWIRRALLRSVSDRLRVPGDPQNRVINGPTHLRHQYVSQVRDMLDARGRENMPIFAVVRRPCSWLEAFWLAETQAGWAGRPDLLGSTFREFVQWHLEQEPGAYQTVALDAVAGASCFDHDYLSDNLVRVLLRYKVGFDATALRETPQVAAAPEELVASLTKSRVGWTRSLERRADEKDRDRHMALVRRG